MINRIICIVLVLLLAVSVTGCSSKVIWTANEFDTEAKKSKYKQTVIAENENFRLEWSQNNCSIALFDKEKGYRWGTTPVKDGEPTVDEFGMPIKKNPILESAIVLDYVNAASYGLETLFSATESVKNGRVIAKKIENGIRVEYYFDSVEIMIPLNYILRDNGVAVVLNPKEIQENENMVAAISLLPYWCSTENKSNDAYLFVPSGSGALVSTKETTASGINYSASVYGRDQSVDYEDYAVIEKAVRLPVYGAKQGETATCAIVETGSEMANISVNAGSTSIGYSAVYSSFQLRSYNESKLTGSANVQDVYAKSMADTLITVGYYPLTNDNANYSGMADTYRNYLKQQGFLDTKCKSIPLSVTIVGGQMVNRSFLGIPYQTLLPATTLSEAQEILEDISTKTDSKISAKLIGFGETGLDLGDYAGGFKISNNLGNKKDLNSLNQYCEENDIDLYFDFDLVRFKNSSSGFSTLFDVAQNACYKITDLYDYNVATRSRIQDTKYNLLAREFLLKGAKILEKKIADWSLSGVSLETLTSLIYSDYSYRESAKYHSKSNMGVDVNDIIGNLKKNYKIAAYDANAYAAVLADIIYDAPIYSAKQNIFSEDVPFYQMVFKGYVNMTAGSNNLSSETRKHLLNVIESGCGINYVVTANYDNEFADSNTYYFFGSKYSDIKDDIEATSNSLLNYYNAIGNATFVSHKILGNGIREIVFDNGVRVYINYSDTSVSTPLGEVESMDFLWGEQQ